MKKVSILTLLILLLAGCRADQKVCDVKAVILEESFFPGNALSDPIDSPIPDAPPESAERIFYVGPEALPDIIQQDVMNFGSARMASSFFEDSEKRLFRTDAYQGLWKVPESLLGYSFAADQSHIACGVDLSEEICRWLARYNGYYIYLQSDISENGMTVNVFVDAAKEIDARMTRCLGN